jgi:hypothetical protein
MALVNLAATRVAPSSPVNRTTTTQHYRTWYRAVIETVGTFLVLAGIAVGILTLRLAVVLIHDVLH